MSAAADDAQAVSTAVLSTKIDAHVLVYSSDESGMVLQRGLEGIALTNKDYLTKDDRKTKATHNLTTLNAPYRRLAPVAGSQLASVLSAFTSYISNLCTEKCQRFAFTLSQTTV